MVDSLAGLFDFLDYWHSDRASPVSAAPAPAQVPVPNALTQVYKRFGSWLEISRYEERPPFGMQDVLLAAKELKLEGEYVRFAVENQGVWSAFYRAADPDGQVLTDARFQTEGSTEQRLEVVTESAADFLTTICLHEAVFSSPYLAGFDDDAKIQDFRKLYSGPYCHRDVPVNVYTDDADTLIVDHAGSRFIGARSYEGLNRWNIAREDLLSEPAE